MGNEPQTVYLVETGCYSDRMASGVFSTRELAEEWITQSHYDLSGDWDERANITEMVIDADRMVLHDWVCVLSLETGDQVLCEQQAEEHARKNAGDARGQRRYELELELQAKEGRDKRIAQQFEDLETSRFIAHRNAAMIAGNETKPGSVDVLDEPFVAPTTDQKVMMDPFYDMWVAGVKK